jgi:hypothetical protein
VAASQQAQHAADVTATWDRGMASLAAHQQYLRGLSEGTDPSGWLGEMARAAGQRLGTGYATTFEVIAV